MTRYTSPIVFGTDSTSKAAWNCSRTVTSNPGTCVFQMSGGTGGCASTGNVNSGISCTWTVPTGVTSITIELWGGGGGGAAPGGMCTCCNYGQGGGGGAYSRKTLAVTAGSQYVLCAGAGGQGGIPSTSSVCCCGQRGVTTYVTGTGLTSFCAEGGYGGESRCYPNGQNIMLLNGGYPGPGGDLNVCGGPGYAWYSSQMCGWTMGGSSPFGGRTIHQGYDCDSQYTDAIGNGKAGGPCGFTGMFPGGGGSGGLPSCCCGICTCGGPGAAGLIRIWM